MCWRTSSTKQYSDSCLRDIIQYFWEWTTPEVEVLELLTLFHGNFQRMASFHDKGAKEGVCEKWSLVSFFWWRSELSKQSLNAWMVPYHWLNGTLPWLLVGESCLGKLVPNNNTWWYILTPLVLQCLCYACLMLHSNISVTLQKLSVFISVYHLILSPSIVYLRSHPVSAISESMEVLLDKKIK